VSRFRRASLGDDFGYAPGEQPPDNAGWLKLNTNESPLPPSSRIADAVAAAADDLHRYPNPYAEPLRSALAAYHGVSAEQVFAGNGADQVLDCCYRAFAAYVWRDCTDYEAKVNRTGLTRALNVLYANYDTDPPTIRVFDEDLAREHAINLTALDALVRSPDFTLEAWLAHDNVAARSYQVLLDFVSRVRTIITWLP